jgi:acetate kinase
LEVALLKILTLNGGSSSLKVSLYDVDPSAMPIEAPRPAWEKRLERLKDEGGMADVVRSMWSEAGGATQSSGEINAVGHRIVHGGSELRASTVITRQVKEAIAKASEFAPEHNRIELGIIEAMENVIGPKTPQIAVFDTAFHATLPPAAYVYPGPYEWLARGIRRYGFHGISHEYVSRRAAELLGRDIKTVRLITCHLGNGCSLAAIRNGESIDTTMGFTPLEGLMMGTRSGSVDPAILIYLLRQGSTPESLDHILNEQSGLKGISGLSGDMRDVLAGIQRGDARARLAFDMYVNSVRTHIGAMLASLGGLDALVFTGGVGENCAPLREAACSTLGFAGIKINPAMNAKPEGDYDIAAKDSVARIFVIHTEEDWQIARECARLTENVNG